MKLQPTKCTRNIPDEELIRDVKAVAKKLRKNTITIQDYSEHGIYHYSTLRFRFRSLYTILQLAGLESTRAPLNVSEELLLKNFENVWNYLGRQPTSKELCKKSRSKSQYCRGTYIQYFGSWRNMLKKFIEYQESKPRSGDDQIVKQVKFFNRLANFKDKKSDYNQQYIPVRLKLGVFMRDGFRCQRCGSSPLATPGIELHCQDIVPRHKGGKTVQHNFRTLCTKCKERKRNSRRGDKKGVVGKSI